MLNVVNAIIVAFMLVPCVFWRRHALLGGALCAGCGFACVSSSSSTPSSTLSTISRGKLRPGRRGDTGALPSGLCNALIIPCLFWTPVRERIQGLLGGCGRSASDASAASVVGDMIGGDVITSLRSAHERLFCIRLSQLTMDDMRNNQDSGLFKLTQKTDPGGVHAFLSHSWRDDSEKKWKRMLEYKDEHASSHGGEEPTCWLDKACIDQASDINQSLKVLPLFLLFSQRFVVFAGQSYTKRL